MVGRYEEATAAYKRAVHRKPDNLLARIGLTATHCLSGRQGEARAAAAEVLRIHPKFSLEEYAKTLPL